MNQPRLRFKEFKSEWEKERASEIFRSVSIKNKSNEPVLSVTQNNGLVYRNLLDKNIRYEKDSLNNYKLVIPSDVVISLRSFQGGFEISDKEGIVSPAYTVMRFNNNNNSYYWKTLFKSHDFIQLLKKVTYGVRDGRSISYKDFSSLKLKFADIFEQQKIGQFFQNLDQQIKLQSDKLEHLKQSKQGYLQKMFPNGDNDILIPILRFYDFHNNWQYKKLGDIGNTFTGLSGKNKEDFGHGYARYVPYMNVHDNPIVDDSDVDKIEIDKKQNELKYGDILFTTSSETPEELGFSSIWLYNKPNVYLNSFCFGYRLNLQMDFHYIAYALRSFSIRKKIILLAQGISRYNLSKRNLMKVYLCIPSLPEQQRIGQFFSHLDRLIDLQQQKVNHLKRQKQAYLQKMFV